MLLVAGPGTARPSRTLVAPVRLTRGEGYDSRSTPTHVLLGDLTGDGRPDVVTTNGATDDLSILLNDGTGSLVRPARRSKAGTETHDAALADFDRDGKLDAAIVGGTARVGVMLGKGNGVFAHETGRRTMPKGWTANVVVAGDVDGDSDADLVVAGNVTDYPNGSGIAVLLGNGNGTFQAPVPYRVGDTCLGCGFSSTGLTLGDLNRDRRPDIVFTDNNTSSGSDSGSVWVLLNRGSAGFTAPAAVANVPGPHSGQPGETVGVADVTGDGIPDIVTLESAVRVDLNGSGGQRGIGVIRGKGDGSFKPTVYVRDPALTDGRPKPRIAGEVVGVTIADVNDDGTADVVTADSGSLAGPGGISVYLNRGRAGLLAPSFLPVEEFTPLGLAVADLNGDRLADVVLENNRSTDADHPANLLVLESTLPAPVLARTVNVERTAGKVRCRTTPGGPFVSLTGGQQLRVGSECDATDGRIELTVATRSGAIQTGVFYGGRFVVSQQRSGLTDLRLTGPLRPCPKCRLPKGGDKKPIRERHLWGRVKGRFRTTGNWASATVRGTVWLTQDFATGTFVSVVSGTVDVLDLRRRKHFIVHRHHHLFVPK